MSTYKYTSVGSETIDNEGDAEIASTKHIQEKTGWRRSKWLVFALGFPAGVTCAVTLMKFASHTKSSLIMPTAGSIVTPFEYNDTFPGPPTRESEDAWLSLLPNGLGFVQHEAFGDGIVDISVFHQLHCLMALRHSIYDSWEGEQHSHMTPHHTKHCLEYIRQSIMCNVDTNVEVRQTFENGEKFTPGWGLKRCRDYERLKQFAEDWRVWDGKVTSTRLELTDPEVVKGRIIHY